MTTSAKLRAYVAEIAKPRPKCDGIGHQPPVCPGCIHADALNAVYDVAPALARLVVQLSEALEYWKAVEFGGWENPSPVKSSYGNHECGCSWDSGPFATHCAEHDPGERLCKALAAVEELEL